MPGIVEYGCPISLSSSGGTINFNPATGDAFYLDPEQCSGFEGPPVRATYDDKARTHGAHVFDSLDGAWVITLGGVIVPADGSPATRNAMSLALNTVLAGMRTGDGTLTQTPTGFGARTVTGLRLEARSQPGAYLKRFLFSIVTGVTDWA